MTGKKQEELPDLVYHRLFQQDADGMAVIDELAARYYDRPSYVPGDPCATSFHEGQRSVILWILQRAGQIE